MKPRFKQALAIGAAALALSGCDPSTASEKVEYFYRKHVTNRKVRETRDKLLKACVRKADPKYELAYNLTNKINEDSDEWLDQTEDTLPFEGIITPVNNKDFVYIDLSTCGMEVRGPSIYCRDSNGDGAWESVSFMDMPPDCGYDSYTKNPKCTALDPADKKRDPQKWRLFQSRCNDAYDNVMLLSKKSKRYNYLDL